MAGDDLDAAFFWCERTDVPDSQRVVHGVGEDVGAVGGEGDAGDGVGVAGHDVQGGGGVAQVPDLDLVVDAPADDLLGSVVEGDRGDLVHVVETLSRVSLALVPHLDH